MSTMRVEIVRVGASAFWWVLFGPHAKAFRTESLARAWANSLTRDVAQALIEQSNVATNTLVLDAPRCPTCGQTVRQP